MKKYNVKKTVKQIFEKYEPQWVEILDSFLNKGTKKTSGNYRIEGEKLVYRGQVTEKIELKIVEQAENFKKAVKAGIVVLSDSNRTIKEGRRIEYTAVRQNVIAIKTKQKDGSELILGNSSVLDLIGGKMLRGFFVGNRAETEIQRALSRLIPVLPFTVFQQARLKVENIQIIERGPEEEIERNTPSNLRKFKTVNKTKENPYGENVCVNPTETVHFTGASLFEIDGVSFLFDVDRNELRHKIFNPFLVKLKNKVSSIAEAYESLKPEDVKNAEKQGLKVKRQGEWFFIPVDDESVRNLETLSEFKKRMELRAGQNRPNNGEGIELVDGKPLNRWGGWLNPTDNAGNSWQDRAVIPENAKREYFLTGKVSHSGREHADLDLMGWFRAVPNTATESFTITGDID